MIATLKPIADRAAAMSTNGRLVLIEVDTNGIAIAGKAFLPGVYAGDPPITRTTRMLSTWQEIAVGGVLPLELAMSRVADALDRALVAK